MKKMTQIQIAKLLGCTSKTVRNLKAANPSVYKFMLNGIACHQAGVKLIQMEFLIFEKDIQKTELAVRTLLGFTRRDQLTTSQISAKEGTRMYAYKFRLKYFQIFGAIAALAGIDEHNLAEYANESAEIKEIDPKNTELPKLRSWK